MDAFLLCPETREYIWLGKPIRFEDEAGQEQVAYFSQNAKVQNYQDLLLNKVLWKFLAEHENSMTLSTSVFSLGMSRQRSM